jgi:hypothetical protein
MKQTNILEKAIQKAIDGGWGEFYSDMNADGITYDMGGEYNLIFNHDFAKALWGEDEHTASPGLDDYGAEKCESCGYEAEQVQPYCWHHHLMRMVIADDPIKYLGENL